MRHAVTDQLPGPAQPPHAIQPRLPFARAPREYHVTIIATGSPAWQARTPACYHSNQPVATLENLVGKNCVTTGKVLARARPPRGRPTPRLRGLPVPRGKRCILRLRLLPSTTGSGVAVRANSHACCTASTRRGSLIAVLLRCFLGARLGLWRVFLGRIQAPSSPVIVASGPGWRAWIRAHAAAWFARIPWWLLPVRGLFASVVPLVWACSRF